MTKQKKTTTEIVDILDRIVRNVYDGGGFASYGNYEGFIAKSFHLSNACNLTSILMEKVEDRKKVVTILEKLFNSAGLVINQYFNGEKWLFTKNRKYYVSQDYGRLIDFLMGDICNASWSGAMFKYFLVAGNKSIPNNKSKKAARASLSLIAGTLVSVGMNLESAVGDH
ncbi:MAG: hypothetical protein HY225_01860 [Candidatus Vogelbacteria bacterium]|nr:hypothetical protein [Candidatus Vogelbacteria bacterium]